MILSSKQRQQQSHFRLLLLLLVLQAAGRADEDEGIGGSGVPARIAISMCNEDAYVNFNDRNSVSSFLITSEFDFPRARQWPGRIACKRASRLQVR
jgi:hypothetical protein